MPKPKKETQKQAYRTFIETIRALRVKVRKELDKNKKGKKIAPVKKKVEKSTATPIKKLKSNLATQDKQRQMRKSLSKKDVERMTDKKKNNPSKKRGGY